MELKSLSQIFENRFFRIPDFQRGYAWEKKQLIDFWRDIENLNSHRFHYTGVLTLENISKEEAVLKNLWNNETWLYDKGYSSFYIIDGQQRILTSMILLKAILEKFTDDEEINFTTKEQYHEKYFYNSSAKAQYSAYIFGYKSDDPSDTYFKKYILEEPVHENIEETLYTANMKNAKDFFKQKLKGKEAWELEQILKKLTLGLKFNIYEVDEELDVYVTFETMNNRGKSLSKLELLKDRLIYLSTLLKDITDDEKDRLRDEINCVWKKVYTYLGKNKDNLLDDDIFLLRHWSIYHRFNDGTPKLDLLLSEYFILDNVNNPDKKENSIGFKEIKNYIDSISECVVHWYYINNPSNSEYGEKVKAYLKKIKRLNNSVFYPAILAVCTKEKDESKIVELLKAIERFMFLVYVCTKRRATTGDSYFLKIAYEYYKESSKTIDDFIESIDGFIDNKKNHYGFSISNFQKEMEELFEKNDGYYSWRGIKYFLYEYELYLLEQSRSNKKVEWADNIIDSIDHIFPQSSTFKPGTQWGRLLGQASHNKKEQKRLLHSLGNLLLLNKKKNSELQGTDFSHRLEHIDKRTGSLTGYRHGSYSENEVASYSKWTADEIYDRGCRMLTFLELRWGVKIEDKIKLLGLEFLDK